MNNTKCYVQIRRYETAYGTVTPDMSSHNDRDCAFIYAVHTIFNLLCGIYQFKKDPKYIRNYCELGSNEVRTNTHTHTKTIANECIVLGFETRSMHFNCVHSLPFLLSHTIEIEMTLNNLCPEKKEWSNEEKTDNKNKMEKLIFTYTHAKRGRAE